MSKVAFSEKMAEVREWLTGEKSHVFPIVGKKFNTLRKYSPSLLKHLPLKTEQPEKEWLLKAVEILNEMNVEKKRKVPEDATVDFIPPSIRRFVVKDGQIDRHNYELDVVTAVRDETKRGNLQIPNSQKFCSLDNFFIPKSEWEAMREGFF